MKQKLMFSLCFAALLISLPVNKVNALEPDTSPFIDFYGELRYIAIFNNNPSLSISNYLGCVSKLGRVNNNKFHLAKLLLYCV